MSYEELEVSSGRLQRRKLSRTFHDIIESREVLYPDKTRKTRTGISLHFSSLDWWKLGVENLRRLIEFSLVKPSMCLYCGSDLVWWVLQAWTMSWRVRARGHILPPRCPLGHWRHSARHGQHTPSPRGETGDFSLTQSGLYRSKQTNGYNVLQV